MIKKILCPTDFSDASTNAIEYAAKVAQRMSSTITMLNVQHIYMGEGVSLFTGGERESAQEAKVTAERMKEYCTEINKTFNVSVNYEIIPTMGSFENIVADESDKFDLIIIGTNGVDNLNQFYLGTHSYRVAKKTTVPVLIIPDGSIYNELSNIVFASDYNKGDELLLKQLKEFSEVFNLQLRVIHISEKDTTQSLESYQAFCNLTKEALNDTGKITFERIISYNGADALDNFMIKTQADMLAVSFKEQGFLYSLFHKNLIKYLTALENYPMLILHA
ncbi:MAG: universal stress protein [Bacteroidia bacterium]